MSMKSFLAKTLKQLYTQYKFKTVVTNENFVKVFYLIRMVFITYVIKQWTHANTQAHHPHIHIYLHSYMHKKF